jgi:glycosyltransferase involved in cell wall biosynthesis
MVSLIIPAKNEAQLVGGCIQAAKRSLDRAASNHEIILVDNDSTDATAAIAEGLGCMVISIRGGTIGALRNAGARAAIGDFLAFLDADCLVFDDWAKCCLERLADAEVGLVGTRAIPALVNAARIEVCWHRMVSGAPRPDRVAWLGSSNMVLRRLVFNEVGGFDESLSAAEDVDLCYRIGRRYAIVLEKRVDTIHLRESKTIGELFRREYARGRNNIQISLHSVSPVREIASMAVPMLNAAAWLGLLVIGFSGSIWFLVPLAVTFGLPIILLAKKNPVLLASRDVFLCYITMYAYLSARSCALVCEIAGAISLKRRRHWLAMKREDSMSSRADK